MRGRQEVCCTKDGELAEDLSNNPANRSLQQPSQQILATTFLPALSTTTWCHQAGCLVATPAAAQVTTHMWTWLGTRMKFPCLKLKTQGNYR